MKYTEEQKMQQWWLWLLLFAINGINLYALIQQVAYDETFGSQSLSDFALFVYVFLFVIFSYALSLVKLEVQVDEKGISYKYFPFQRKYKLILWEIIEEAYVRTYSPIKEYGGWGIRGLRKNRAINISGNQGLQLRFKDGCKFLIGTQNPSEINEAVGTFFRKG